MRFYLTHCSKEKEPYLEETGIAVTPDKLYINPDIQQFMERCKEKKVRWGVLSDLYGVYLSDEFHVWYEKHPDTVTQQEEDEIVKDFDSKLVFYNEILFCVRPDSFHPFYERVLKRTLLAPNVKTFQSIERIE